MNFLVLKNVQKLINFNNYNNVYKIVKMIMLIHYMIIFVIKHAYIIFKMNKRFVLNNVHKINYIQFYHLDNIVFLIVYKQMIICLL